MSSEKPRSSIGDVLRDYWRHTKRYPLLMGVVFVAASSIEIASVIAPLYLKKFLDVIFTTMPQVAAPELVYFLWFFAFFSLLAWVFRRVRLYALVEMESRVMTDIDVASFNYIIRHSYHFFISNFVGTLVRRVARYSKSYEEVTDAIVMHAYPTALFTLGVAIVLSWSHHLLGILLGVWAVIFVILQILLVRTIQPRRLKAAEEDSRLTGTLADTLANYATTTLFAGLAHEHTRFTTVASDVATARRRAWHADDTLWAVQGFLMLIITVGLFFMGLSLWKQGMLTVGDFVLIQSYLLMLFERLVSLGRELRRVFTAFADAAEMSDILRTPHEIREHPSATTLFVPHGVIHFNNVSFGFQSDRPILQNLSLRVKSNEKVALVGPSGAGKTTITKLLLRLYDVQTGSIEIDGQDIAHATLDSLREAVSFVPQEPLLFHRSLMENIRYGRRDASDDEVFAAAKKAYCHGFISGLSQGYDTLVGERGVKLSGGERQRIAIARAILKNAPVLVLDEATSSLDSESEALIQDALKNLMQGKTVVVIAHRLSTIMRMDRIVVIENGRISAEGRHEDLLKEGGRYQKLWEIQAGGFQKDEITVET